MSTMSIYALLESVVKRAISTNIDYAHPWACTVQTQIGDTVDVKPDNSKLPDLLGIPIRTGVPDVSAKVKIGSRCRVFFDDGDPAKPYVALWDIAEVESISLAGSSGTLAPVARQGDAVVVTIDVKTISAAAAVGATGTIELPGVIMSGSSRVSAS